MFYAASVSDTPGLDSSAPCQLCTNTSRVCLPPCGASHMLQQESSQQLHLIRTGILIIICPLACCLLSVPWRVFNVLNISAIKNVQLSQSLFCLCKMRIKAGQLHNWSFGCISSWGIKTLQTISPSMPEGHQVGLQGQSCNAPWLGRVSPVQWLPALQTHGPRSYPPPLQISPAY